VIPTEQIRVALEPVEKRMRELERENEELRRQLGKPGPSRMWVSAVNG